MCVPKRVEVATVLWHLFVSGTNRWPITMPTDDDMGETKQKKRKKEKKTSSEWKMLVSVLCVYVCLCAPDQKCSNVL